MVIYNSFIVCLLIGHLLGDYVFQTNWMAMNKSKSTYKCIVHCLSYTTLVWILTVHFIPLEFAVLWILFIFISHFPIDRWSLADKWLKLIGGRSISEFLINGEKDIPFSWDSQEYWNYHTLRAGFTALCYAVVDNTFHIILMLIGYKILV